MNIGSTLQSRQSLPISETCKSRRTLTIRISKVFLGRGFSNPFGALPSHSHTTSPPTFVTAPKSQNHAQEPLSLLAEAHIRPECLEIIKFRTRFYYIRASQHYLISIERNYASRFSGIDLDHDSLQELGKEFEKYQKW